MKTRLFALIFILSLAAAPALAADTIQNGDFSNGLTSWTHVDVVDTTTPATDSALFGAAAPSLQDLTGIGRRLPFEWYDEQTITTTINSTDSVNLSLWWAKTAIIQTGGAEAILSVIIEKPSSATATLWSDISAFVTADVPITGSVNQDVSSFFDESGTYKIRLHTSGSTGSKNDAQIQVNWDDVVLDVSAVVNSAPTIVAGATTVSSSPVNRVGVNSTVISADFTDSDEPGVAAFTASFRIREPDDTTVVTLVDNQANGGGGLSITDNGGGSYTASYSYDPDAAQPLGLYDLRFEVSDGTDNAADDYTSNLDELEIIEANAPTVVAGATQASVSPVNRFGSDTTVLSADFTDVDQPGVGAFTATFGIREPDDSTELILVNNQPNGGGGLTITDNGGGSYTASYSYDPGVAQTLGLYDLFFEVTDGTGNGTDGYANNLDELEIVEITPPALVAGATQVSVSPVNRVGSGVTVLSADFTDSDQPGVGGFTATFRIREPDDSTELTLVDNQPNGSGGLIITDNGGGSYTASYSYDPGAAQTLGLYDLSFEVSDGSFTASDVYTDNLDELEIIEQNAPTVVAGATQVTVSPVNRLGADTTVISADFTDVDQPAVSAFAASFRIREPNDTTVLTLVDNQPNGGGGLSITDNGGGSYTASYSYDPAVGQTVGLYDLQFEISDGVDSATDGYASNLDELEIIELNPPIVTAGAASASKTPVARLGTDSTTLFANFTDADQPGVGAFSVTLKLREPDNATEVLLASNATNGAGITISDLGGGSYRAELPWDPDSAQTLGLYDLFFEVDDGSFIATDDYTNNLDELEVIENPVNAIPSIVAGNTAVSVSPVNRAGANATVISTTFVDGDVPGVAAFNVTFRIREPDDSTELILVNNQPNGGGGLTITDNGGGSYTASYSFDPGAAQTLGLYDLQCEVSDGADTATDGYADNLDELEIIQQSAPSVVAGATQTSVSPVNRADANATVLSADFTDLDQPGVGAFTASFMIREPDDSTQLILVNDQPNGSGGLTITDNGGGSYTASYSYDPGAAQALGLYDLRFEISDGIDSAADDYANNLDELEIYELLPNDPPTLTPGAVMASISPVNRVGASVTTISATFTDSDAAGVGVFTATFRIREPDNTTELTLVNAQPSGSGGLTITDNGGGSYTASYVYDPDDAQTLGFYDLFFEVSDGEDTGSAPYTANLDELQIVDIPGNNLPVIVAGATQVSVSPVNRFGGNTTVISAVFSDGDQPPILSFTVSFKIREPDNSTELVLVNAQTHGNGGLVISDLGGGSYSATYTYDPGPAQTLGLYDLYCEISDGTDTAIDGYASNVDELEIDETIPNNAPWIVPGATAVSVSPLNRLGSNSTVISTTFTDVDQPGVGAFIVSFRIREPDDTTEVVLVDSQTHGNGGLSITDGGLGSYTASFTYDPIDTQALGPYDLYFEVSDGSDSVIDGYANNSGGLQIIEFSVNAVPTIAAGATSVNPSSIDRAGAATTQFVVDFDDADDPGVGAFTVTILAREPNSANVQTISDALQNGVGGLSIVANGGGSYTATIDWDPADNAVLGYYDLQAEVSDGEDLALDDFINNSDELLLTNGGENIPPIVASDATYATPGAIERIGANATTLTVTFTDGDAPAVSTLTVTFKVREPDDSTEIVLADGLSDGQGGVSIVHGGGGVYTATIAWDPADGATLGVYDLYFSVSDGLATSIDGFANNVDELELYDAVSNNAPTMVAGSTTATPSSITRVGTDFTMIKALFSDADVPGTGGFLVTIKVRDSGSTEYTLVNLARHGEQGLRIRHVSGNQYQATYLWDPAIGQVTGDYDLYAYVEDDLGVSATDDYVNNDNELTVTANVVPGDGNLLHRTNDAASCASCHDIVDHQAQDCLICHTPHSSTNIYLVRETIQTPNSGAQSVIFKTLGIGDPYNGPDPTPGDPTSGVMADDSDGVFTGVCEVCHTTTTRHRNSTVPPGPVTGHENSKDCTGCHPHTEGFAVSGGGESGGGANCSCHSSIFTPMNTSTTSYHHQMTSDDANYTISARTCLMCHVDHDIFRPDLNTGIGQRSKNLRADITSSVAQGDAGVLANYDYTSSGTGGICLSCHSSAQTKSYTQPDGTTQTPAISKSDFDAATSAHNYFVTSTFSSDGSTFNGNCVKCHNDTMSKSYQNSTEKFSTHDAQYRRVLNPMGEPSPSDPLEENFCFQCHSTTSNPNAGSNQDYFATKSMSATALAVEGAFSKTFGHPTTSFSGRHKPDETAADLADGSTRHAECGDCHNVHTAQQGTHDGSTNLVSNALKGTWGVEPSAWPAAPQPSDNANVFAAPASFTRVEPAIYEYQICLKCHSNYTTLPSGSRNLAEEINPNYPSTHAVVAPVTNPSIRGTGPNPFCNSTTMFEPWGTSKLTWCSDCHRSDSPSDPGGPHGSNAEHLLVATIVSNDVVGTPLCDVCHRPTVYWNGSADPSRYSQHPATKGAHQLAFGCFMCHMWEFASTPGLGVQSTESLAAGTLNVHGQNKYWNFNERTGGAGHGEPVDAFVNGYLADMDYANRQCWAEVCKTHAGQGY